jgi:hypothetical protein
MCDLQSRCECFRDEKNVFLLKEFEGKRVKFSLEQTMKAQRGSRGIAVLFL